MDYIIVRQPYNELAFQNKPNQEAYGKFWGINFYFETIDADTNCLKIQPEDRFKANRIGVPNWEREFWPWLESQA